MHRPRKSGARPHALLETFDAHPSDASLYLTKRRARCQRRLEGGVRPDEAFTADGSDFDRVTVLQRRDDGEDGVDWKIDVTDGAADGMEKLVSPQVNDRQVALDRHQVARRQSVEEATSR